MIIIIVIGSAIMRLNLIRTNIDNTWTVTRIAREKPPISWEKVFKDMEPELDTIEQVLEEQQTIYGDYYPLRKNIFCAYDQTPLHNVKVVIIGQDPYFQTIVIDGVAQPRATGLAFSVDRRDTVPVSLKNIYKELSNTIPDFAEPKHGDLTEWANQGVLLLNMSLTVRAGVAGSHGDIWLGPHRKTFKAIAEINPRCIYLLWGKEAQKISPMLGERSIILEAAHPASRNGGWFGNNHFNLVNEILVKQGKTPINWKLSNVETLSGQNIYVTNRDENRKLVPININELSNISVTPIKVVEKQRVYEQTYVPLIQPVRTSEPVVVPQIPRINFDIPNSKFEPQSLPIIPSLL